MLLQEAYATYTKAFLNCDECMHLGNMVQNAINSQIDTEEDLPRTMQQRIRWSREVATSKWYTEAAVGELQWHLAEFHNFVVKFTSPDVVVDPWDDYYNELIDIEEYHTELQNHTSQIDEAEEIVT